VRQSTPLVLTLASSEATRAAGRRLGQVLRAIGGAPLLVGLTGELGAGKTTFVTGVLAAFGVPGPVRSPTYTLVEPYESANRRIYHLDLYRLVEPAELEALAVRDLFEPDAVLLVEWVERGRGVLPEPDLTISLSYAPESPQAADSRVMKLSAGSESGWRVVDFVRADSTREKGSVSP